MNSETELSTKERKGMAEKESLTGLQSRSTDNEKQRVCTGSRIFRTVSSYVTFLGAGMMSAALGASLLHLQYQTNSSDAQIASGFFVRPLGALSGSVLTMVLFDRFPKDLYLAIGCVSAAVATLLMPYCTSFGTLMVALLLQGLPHGMIGSGINVYIVQIWKAHSAPFTQALHFVSSFGAFLMPSMMSLLVHDLPSEQTNEANSWNETRLPQNARGFVDSARDQSVSFNSTTDADNSLAGVRKVYTIVACLVFTGGCLYVISFLFTTVFGKSSGKENIYAVDEPTSKPEVVKSPIKHEIHDVASLVGSVLALSSASINITSSNTLNKNEENSKMEEERNSAVTKNTEPPLDERISMEGTWSAKVTGKVLLAFMVVGNLLTYLCCALESSFAAWILAFIVRHIKGEFSVAIQINAAFWGCLALGRFFSIFTAMFFKAKTILMMHSVVLFAILLFYGFAYHLHISVSWVCTALVGFTIAPLFGQTLTAYRDYVSDSSAQLASLIVSLYVGFMTMPSLIGLLFSYASPLWFTYIMIITSATHVMTTVVLQILVAKTRKHRLNM